METLRNVFHRRAHPSWRNLCDAWTKLTHSAFLLKCECSSLEYKEWNPWKDWCNSWEEINYSLDKTPKSEMSRANLFFELSTLAELTRDKLEEAKTTAQENQRLMWQNFALQKKCDELQSQLYAEKQMRLENDLSIKYNLEKEVQLKNTLEDQEVLTFHVKKKETELEQALTKCNELVNTLSDYGGQLEKYDQRIGYQVNIKNDIIVVPSPNMGENRPWTPQEQMSLIEQLPDPVARPIPYYRQMSQIQSVYNATWQDLTPLTALKVGKAVGEIINDHVKRHCGQDFDQINVLDWGSGQLYMTGLQHWAKTKLQESSLSLTNVVQEKGETIESFFAKLQTRWADLEYNGIGEMGDTVLALAFVNGLKPSVKKKLQDCKPEWRQAAVSFLLKVAKGIELNERSEKAAGRLKQRNLKCYFCGKPGHIKRECRKFLRQK
ncbi:uncharacterized protein [Eleutherodactylus coqui]